MVRRRVRALGLTIGAISMAMIVALPTATLAARSDSARGGRSFTFTAGASAGSTFAFELAVRTVTGGSTTGSYTEEQVDGPNVVVAALDCLVVADDVAYVGGIIVESEGPDESPVGSRIILAVSDGGEGRGSVDRVTIHLTDGKCTDAAVQATLDEFLASPEASGVVTGNVQVKDR